MKYVTSLLFVLLVSLALAFGQAANSGGNSAGGTDNGNMPKTASPLPELALLGLSSLGVGGLLRKRRKV